MFFMGEEETGKLFPPRGLVSLLGLSMPFCWVMDGAHQSLHSSEVPGRGGGHFKSCLCFFSPSCRRHEGPVFRWFGFGEFVTLGRKPCSFSKDKQELSGNERLV